MKKLSPADALGPAFRRVREVMIAPFRLGFFLKIALVAALTQPGFYSVLISYPMQGLQMGAGALVRRPGHMHFTVGGGGPIPTSPSGTVGVGGLAIFGVFAIVLFIGLLLWVLVTYL